MYGRRISAAVIEVRSDRAHDENYSIISKDKGSNPWVINIFPSDDLPANQRKKTQSVDLQPNCTGTGFQSVPAVSETLNSTLNIPMLYPSCCLSVTINTSGVAV